MKRMRDAKRRPTHPGEVLRADVLPALEMSQGELAKRLGVSRLSVSELLHGKRALSADMAVRIARLTSTTPESWLRMQSAVDLWELEHQPEWYRRIEPLAAVVTSRARSNLPAAVAQDDWLTEQLRDAELSAEYLNAALAEGDQAAFMLALRNVAKARGGVAAVARHAAMNRVAVSRALSGTGNPELRSLTRILDASGLKLLVASRTKVPVRRRTSIAGRSARTGARRAA